MNDHITSDEYLNSFVDNQLDPDERIRAFDTISKNEALRERVCELQNLKELVHYAYYLPTANTAARENPQRRLRAYLQPLAACLLLLVGGVSGWMGHSWAKLDSDQDASSFIQTVQRGDNTATESRKIIVHISNSAPMKLKAALDETESLLNSYKHAKQMVQLEVIANKQGVDLLRTQASIYRKRIEHMQEKYPNLHFLVCGQTMAKLSKSGENIQLLPHTEIAKSAADQINKRLLQGWGYVKI